MISLEEARIQGRRGGKVGEKRKFSLYLGAKTSYFGQIFTPEI